MANLSNPAYDGSIVASGAMPAMLNLKKLMQEERVSQSPAAASTNDAIASGSPTQTIETRFGPVVFNLTQPITFTRGLLGMPDKQRFGIADFPNARFAQFKLLQALEDKNLSFITMPLELQPDLIRVEDLQRACDDVSIAFSDLAVLLIVTVHRGPAGSNGQTPLQLSVNTRAPLMVDAQTRQALQYVFPHDRYLVQQTLKSDAQKAE